MICSVHEFVALRTSDSPDDQMRAGTEEAPLSVWLGVIAQFPELRVWVIHNKTVPIQILERLSVDSSVRVRCAVADKRKLTPELRSYLSKDIDASVRARVACNAKCEIELLRVLANDPEPFVSDAARAKLSERNAT